MKKITAFIGSPRKKHTFDAVSRFLENLKTADEVETEIVFLGDFKLENCCGCKACFERGEEFCPFRDDRDLLIEKMTASDGVVFASPVYSFQVTALMKNFLDRLAFIFHRPRFFGKMMTSIVAQGIYGGKKVVEYLDFCGNGLGFNILKGVCINSLEPVTEKQARRTNEAVDDHSRKFLAALARPAYPAPGFFDLMIFRMSRTSMKRMLDEGYRDFRYFRDKGWFESGYYYPARLNPFKKIAGRLFDSMAAFSFRNHDR